jgi:putative transposase
VFNDGPRPREDARAAGLPFPNAAELSQPLITRARPAPEREWLGEVSSVVPRRSPRDLETAHGNVVASLRGERAGARVGPPRFTSRKDHRQAIRFTANARWKITADGRLSLPRIGEVRVTWSRRLPSVPSSVTVVKDAPGRFLASLVVETDPEADLTRFPDTGRQVGLDLGLTRFAVPSDGTRLHSPRFPPGGEEAAPRATGALRKRRGGDNREKARVRVPARTRGSPTRARTSRTRPPRGRRATTKRSPPRRRT